MIIHVSNKLDLQLLVIRNEQDFLKMLPLKNFLVYLGLLVKPPLTKDSIIQADWSHSEERALGPSSEEDPPEDF